MAANARRATLASYIARPGMSALGAVKECTAPPKWVSCQSAFTASISFLNATRDSSLTMGSSAPLSTSTAPLIGPAAGLGVSSRPWKLTKARRSAPARASSSTQAPPKQKPNAARRSAGTPRAPASRVSTASASASRARRASLSSRRAPMAAMACSGVWGRPSTPNGSKTKITLSSSSSCSAWSSARSVTPKKLGAISRPRPGVAPRRYSRWP